MTTVRDEAIVPPLQSVAHAKARRREFSSEVNAASRKALKGRRLLLEDSDSDSEATHIRRNSLPATSPTSLVPTISFQEIISNLDIPKTDLNGARTDESVCDINSTLPPPRRHKNLSISRSKDLPNLPTIDIQNNHRSYRRHSRASSSSSAQVKRGSIGSLARISDLQGSRVSLIETEGLGQEDLELLKTLKQRQAVIRELVVTESSFSEDMAVVVQEYQEKTGTCPPLSPEDVRQIFGGVEPVLSFSTDFAFDLQTSAAPVLFSEAVTLVALQAEDHLTTIGLVFGQSMSRLSKVFSRYCSSHEVAASYLLRATKDPAVQSWLAERHPVDRTTAWDLPSLLIKPVQRIMKYPLLLSALLESTPKTHPDYYAIDLALKEMLFTAENINNIKKRRDIVGSIAAEKKKNEFSVLARTFQRRTAKVKQSAGLEPENDRADCILEDLARKFRAQLTVLQNLRVELDEWLIVMKSSLDYHAGLALAFEHVRYCRDVPPSSVEPAVDWNRYTQAIEDLQQGAFFELTHSLESDVYRPLANIEQLFKRPGLVLAKRDSLVDHFRRACSNRAKMINSDRDLRLAADEYVQLNDSLIQDLPTFLGLARKAMDTIVADLAGVQSNWYRSWYLRFGALINKDSSATNVVEHFHDRETIMLVQMAELDLTNGALAASNQLGMRHATVSEESLVTSDVSSKISSVSTRPTIRHRALSVASNATGSLKQMSNFGRPPSGSTTPTMPSARASFHGVI